MRQENFVICTHCGKRNDTNEGSTEVDGDRVTFYCGYCNGVRMWSLKDETVQ